MNEVVLVAPPSPGVWSMIGEDVDSVFARDPAARNRFEVCDAKQVCEPPDQRYPTLGV